MFVLITNRAHLYPEYTTHTFYSFIGLTKDELLKIKYVYVETTLVTAQLRKLGGIFERYGILQVDDIPKDPNNCMYVKLPHSGKVVSINALSMADLSSLGVGSADELREVIMRLDRIRSRMDERRINMEGTDKLIREALREHIKVLGKVNHTRPFTEASVTTRNPKPFLIDPRPGQYFATKQELADHLVSRLPEGVEIRKRNALRFKICVEMNEEDLVTLAANKLAQNKLLAKYQ